MGPPIQAEQESGSQIADRIGWLIIHLLGVKSLGVSSDGKPQFAAGLGLARAGGDKRNHNGGNDVGGSAPQELHSCVIGLVSAEVYAFSISFAALAVLNRLRCNVIQPEAARPDAPDSCKIQLK
jgi:hypothetical protein